jgi:hypothetical protein
MHFQFATVAGTGIDHPDGQAFAENAQSFRLACCAELHHCFVMNREFFRQTTCFENLTKNTEHSLFLSSC